jgi:hypothetical protein
MVEEGREDVRSGDVVSQEEIEQDLERWLGQYEVFPDKVAVIRVIHASRDFLKAWRGVDR